MHVHVHVHAHVRVHTHVHAHLLHGLNAVIYYTRDRKGLRKTDDKVHPGFAISQGMVATTLEENRRLLVSKW